MKNSFLINTFDLYGTNFSLYLFGKSKYKTIVGALMGFISLCAILATSIFFINDLFQRTNMTLIYNEDKNISPVVNLTDSPLVFGLFDNKVNIIPEEKLYSFQMKVSYYINDIDPATGRKTGTKLTALQVPLEKCNITKHFGAYGDLFSESLPSLERQFCITPGTVNLTVFGKFGDTANGFSQISFYVNKCNPGVGPCYNQTYSESKLAVTYLYFAYLTN
jgi:hypothetical protein